MGARPDQNNRFSKNLKNRLVHFQLKVQISCIFQLKVQISCIFQLEVQFFQLEIQISCIFPLKVKFFSSKSRFLAFSISESRFFAFFSSISPTRTPSSELWLLVSAFKFGYEFLRGRRQRRQPINLHKICT